MEQKKTTTRRDFLQTSAAGASVAAVGFWAAGGVTLAKAEGPNDRIQFASVGIGGKGGSDSGDANGRGDLVAICDVDTGRLAGAEKKYKGAKAFTDYRKLLDEMDKKVDAVTVSTPDHMHAMVATAAMARGKHCFCQKPLTRTISEARYMGDLARKMKVKTQMGNQGTANNALRKAAALIRAGRLGELKEVHVWTNRPVWPQGGPRPEEQPVPGNLKWDEWLGCAPKRPYGKGYHPFSWRGWWDFGTGALGDMACHTVNMPYMGCELRDPTAVQAVTSGTNRDSYPSWSRITFDFPAVSWRKAIKFYWYDGGQRPTGDILEGKKPAKSGALVVGTKGKIFSSDDYCGRYETLGEVDQNEEGLEYEKSPGHFNEWVQAIKGEIPAAKSDFAEYAGGLTETILLGNLAVWAAGNVADGQKEVNGPVVKWDAKALKVVGTRDFDVLVDPEYHNGYKLGGK